MKNSNIIISVIIVLCIASGVSAYSILNPEGSIFSLPGFTPSDNGDGGDLGTGNGLNGTGTNDSGAGGGTGSGGSSGGGSGSGGSGGGSNVHIGMTASQAQAKINSAVSEPGSYAGRPTWNGSINMWVAKIYDKNGTVVDSIGIDANGRTNRV